MNIILIDQTYLILAEEVKDELVEILMKSSG